jgi:small-conductance mechanosensitive channel
MGLDSLGVNITALVASLGVGGIAVALAVQNILGDLFASLSILLDRPFEVGDFIVVTGDHMGTIEKIGLKTTRVRSLSGEQLIFPNSDLLQSRVKNFKRMQERRVVLNYGLVYGTPAELLAKIPEMTRSIIEQEKQVRFERSHFARLGSSALELEAIYWILDPDYNLYMDIQQRIALNMYNAFNAAGIVFALPTQFLHVRQVETK